MTNYRFDIGSAIMDSRKLDKIEAVLRKLVKNPYGIKPSRLEAVAKRLGRTRKAGFTNEPTYVRNLDPALSPPLSIPAHPTLRPGTAKNIIRALLDDVDDWRTYLQQGEQDD